MPTVRWTELSKPPVIARLLPMQHHVYASTLLDSGGSIRARSEHLR